MRDRKALTPRIARLSWQVKGCPTIMGTAMYHEVNKALSLLARMRLIVDVADGIK